jgi:Mn2+/Fe2+ NRAMP family transporter
MTPMLYVSLLLNVAVLIPVCLGLARGARWADEAWGSPGPARGILLSIYAAILILSVLLLLLGQPLPAAPLLAVQILYKLMAPFIVRDWRNPVILSNLAIAAVHCVTLAGLWSGLRL